jgi:hypothetical protein
MAKRNPRLWKSTQRGAEMDLVKENREIPILLWGVIYNAPPPLSVSVITDNTCRRRVSTSEPEDGGVTLGDAEQNQ